MNNITTYLEHFPSSLHNTPFHLPENFSMYCENHNKNCTHAEIDLLNAKGILGTVDFTIMKLLKEYFFLNTYNIKYALDHILDENYKKPSYNKNLKKLTKSGILLRHSLCDCNKTTTQEHQTPGSPLRFYSLSPGAQSYMTTPTDISANLLEHWDDYKIMELLSINQLLLRIEKRNIIQKQHYVRKIIGHHKFMIDCHLKYHVDTRNIPSPISIFLFSCRTHEESKKDFILRIYLFLRWMDQHKIEYPSHLILILCESITELPLIHSSIMALRTQYKYPIYYTFDTELLNVPVFSSLYQCVLSSNTESFNIEHIRLII